MAYVQEKSIGGSDVGSILGLNPYRSAAKVWDAIMSAEKEQRQVGGGDDTGFGNIARGNDLEDVAVQLYCRKYPTVFGVKKMERVRHATHPFHASPDREARFGLTHEEDEFILLEVKCPARFAFSQLEENGIPPSYVAQMQHYLYVTGYEACHFIALDYDNWTVWDRPVVKDPEYEARIVPFLLAWWERHVVGNVRPEDAVKKSPNGEMQWPKARVGVDTPLDVSQLDPEKAEEWALALKDLKAAREGHSLYEASKKLAENKVKTLMGDLPLIEYPTIGKISWKDEAGRVSFDDDALAAAKPLDREKLREALNASNTAGATHLVDVLLRRINDDTLNLDLSQFRTRTATRTFRPKFST